MSATPTLEDCVAWASSEAFRITVYEDLLVAGKELHPDTAMKRACAERTIELLRILKKHEQIVHRAERADADAKTRRAARRA
jgi:hypothetical protein